MRFSHLGYGAEAYDSSGGSSDVYGPINPGPAYTLYTVKSGDTLGTIAAIYLGDPGRWKEIWNANPGIVNPDVISVGDTLQIPSVRVAAPAPTAPGVMPGPKIAAVTATPQDSFLAPGEVYTAPDGTSVVTPASASASALTPGIMLGIAAGMVLLILVASKKSRTLVV